MDETKLMGFCKKCEWPLEMLPSGQPQSALPFGVTVEFHEVFELCNKCEPVWFLSSYQQRILENSKEYLEWVSKQNIITHFRGQSNTGNFTDDNPFLVAKILKKTGEINV